MIQVWKYDDNKVFIESTFVEEVVVNMTTTPILIGYYKPTFNEETQEWREGATQEEIEEIKRQEEESRPPQEPNKIEILEGKMAALEESQLSQDTLIDDIIFEVIPSLETQIASSTTNPGEVATLLNKNIKKLKTNKKGRDGMAAYLAKKIIEGRDYRTVFKTNAYKQYQDEVDTILELEGRGDLIDRRL